MATYGSAWAVKSAVWALLVKSNSKGLDRGSGVRLGRLPDDKRQRRHAAAFQNLIGADFILLSVDFDRTINGRTHLNCRQTGGWSPRVLQASFRSRTSISGVPTVE